MPSVLENKTIFFSRLGFEMDPARFDEQGKLIEFGGDYAQYARYHRDMHELGIHVHTSILFSGWVGEDLYDYTLTDRTLDMLFSILPEDAMYIPRVKLNAPVEWSKKHPEELCVYYGGNNDPEYIRTQVGSLTHDLLGYEAPNGYYMGKDRRPNLNGFFSNQSFASERWKRDAAKALISLMRHVASKPYGKRILGWHIAYGVSGETCLWGRFGREYGDYSRIFHRAFLRWGERKYGSREKCLQVWGTQEMPSPAQRKNVCTSVEAFLRKRPCDRIVRDLDLFMSELNASTAEFFCRTVKEESPGALTGIFYGYSLECHNAAYTGWLGMNRILQSPFIDFLAAPCSYFRRGAGESGGFIAPAQSVRLRKYWVDELDIRTYLAKDPGDWGIPEEYTKAVFYRDLARNLSADAGYWWMDLGGGWYDSEKIHNLIREVEETAEKIRKDKHKSTADVLILYDEQATVYHTESMELFMAYRNFRREIALSGTIIDLYRTDDMPQLNLNQYKLIILCDCPEKIVLPKDKVVLFTYLDSLPDGLSVQERKGECFSAGKLSFCGIFSGQDDLPLIPVPRVVPQLHEKIQIHALLQDNSPAVVSCGKVFYSILPVLGWKQIRALAEFAGCRTYGEAPCTVYGDKRFTAVFSHRNPADFSIIRHGSGKTV